ncbi:MAG TPA: pyrroloquinoline quinone biosynthesis protein PqqB [Flavobacteriaceae bacterium]|nr:pyrroloquinoline quinone biosynthesis protein PqqB [Flavobacteriaceae bacterium]
MRFNHINVFVLLWLFTACNNTVGVSDVRQSDVTIDRDTENTQSKATEPSLPTMEHLDPKAKVVLSVLGVMQDGGRPHLGCQKSCCAADSIQSDVDYRVVSLGLFDREHTKGFMIEATPDFVAQWRTFKGIFSEVTLNTLGGIFLTHAHIGHYLGLSFLGKEAYNAKSTPVYAMPRMTDFLKNNGPWSQLVTHENIELRPTKANDTVQLTKNLSIIPLVVPHRDEYSETVGYQIIGPEKSAVFIPDIDKWDRWDQSILCLIKLADYAFLDATFYDGQELPNRDMSSVPHPFIVESLELFDVLETSDRNKVYFIHFNHTNPVLDKDSEAAKRVKRAGFNIAKQGQLFSL